MQRNPTPLQLEVTAPELQRLPWLLCGAIILLQPGYWLAGVDDGPAKTLLAALEMLPLLTLGAPQPAQNSYSSTARSV